MIEFYVGLLVLYPDGELYAQDYQRQKVTLHPDRSARKPPTNRQPLVFDAAEEEWGALVGAAFYWEADAPDPFETLRFPAPYYVRRGDKVIFPTGQVSWE